MKEGKQLSFYELIKETAILIPQIQRDYIQYRTGRVEKNLKRLIEKLVDALVDKKPINLNFVYGVSDVVYAGEQCLQAFVPIDGQQRLTTLFLLYYYIFSKAGAEKAPLKNRLFYKTRSATQDFLDALLEHTDTLCDRNPSEVIREQSWFSSLWNSDPSVLSCLTVLDQIQIEFNNKNVKDWKSLADTLTGSSCPIAFMKLEIEDIDKPNELYIKMNSRGKQLTAFENFKADLYAYIGSCEKFDQKFKQSFKEKMDGAWLGFVWSLIGEKYQEKHTDVLYRELLHWIIINRISSNAACDTINAEDIPPEKCYLSDYSPDCLVEAIRDIYFTIEALCKLETKHPAVSIIFDLSEDKSGFVSGLSTYMHRVLLFAVTVFARAHENSDAVTDTVKVEDFNNWWRVARNLITNSQIDRQESYKAAIKAISDFIDFGKINEKLHEKDEKADKVEAPRLPALHESQWREEILKQKLIEKPEGWKNAIQNAEKNVYFNGEILFALSIAGVSSADEANGDNLNNFEKYWKLIETVFGDGRDDTLLHRLLLIYWDYSETISDYSDNTGSENLFWSYYYNDTKHHNQDWRGMLRKEKNREKFKRMLDEFSESGKPFEDFAKNKIRGIKDPENLEYVTEKQKRHFYFYLITEETLFNYIKAYNRCWCKDGEIYLLPTSNRRRALNYMLFVLYENILKKNVNVKYIEKTANDEEDYIIVDEKKYYYRNGKFCDENKNEIGNTIKNAVQYITSQKVPD